MAKLLKKVFLLLLFCFSVFAIAIECEGRETRKKNETTMRTKRKISSDKNALQTVTEIAVMNEQQNEKTTHIP